MSDRDLEHAEPSPSISSQFSYQPSYIPLLDELALSDKGFSLEGESENFDEKSCVSKRGKKTQLISKERAMRKGTQKYGSQPKQTAQKKINRLEGRIKELESELQTYQSQPDHCPKCYYNFKTPKTPSEKREYDIPPLFYGELNVGGNSGNNSPRGERGSMQFEKVNFFGPTMFNQQFDEKAWVFLGTIMIAMGSKCMDIDGTLNVFKVLKESVDSLRRQVDKSEPNITMDFFLGKEEMQENQFVQEIGFDPFTSKTYNEGLLLEGLKVESVEQFQLVYDNKLTFNLKYQALLTAMEYMREASWITSP